MFHLISDTALLNVMGAVPISGFDRIMAAMASNWLFTVGMIIAVVAIVFGNIGNIVRNSTRERTRREIAAYIAEGSMTPEQGERLIQAKFRDSDS